MPTKQQEKKTVTVKRDTYEALVHSVQITNEFLSGEKKSFFSAKDLIRNLKKL